MAKLVKRGKPPEEFIDEDGKMLFDDIDGPVDDAWQAAMQDFLWNRKKSDSSKSDKPDKVDNPSG